MRRLGWVLAVLAATSLAACSLPRGAALQREILAGADDEFPEIAVYPVTRSFLPVVARWPSTGAEPSAGWIAHSHSRAVADVQIQPFDTINLTVWDSEPNSLLTSEQDKNVAISNLRVNERGQIFVPYIGHLAVAGRTPDNARAMVEREMAAIVPSAQIQLQLEPGSKGSVNLVGGVANPGTYPLPEQHFTVLDLIAQGGGPAGMRNPQVRLVRAGRTYVTSYESLLEQPGRNSVLRGGDKVALEEDDRYFRALGATGIEQLVYFEEDRVTAADALSMMGGVNDRRADPRGVLILREYPAPTVRLDGTGPANTRTIFTIDLTSADGLFSAGQFEVYPGDTVLATESVITTAEAVAVLAGTFIGLSRTVSASN
ncbi:MAG: polysaccharide biosynthesis/export family protein [Pseudomonadota bacterium]